MECEDNIYAEIGTIGNPCYEADVERKEATKRNTFKFKIPAVVEHSKKKILAIGSLLVLIATVAAGTAYAVHEISKLKSTSDKAELQQNAAFASMLDIAKRNASLEVMMQQQLINELEARIEQLRDSSNFNAETIATLDARIAQQNVSLEVMLQQQLIRKLEARIQQLHNSNLVTAGMLANLDARITQQNVSLEVMMQQRHMRELEARMQQLRDSSTITARTLDTRITQVQTSSQNAIQKNSAKNRQLNDSISVLSSVVGHSLTSCSALPTSFSAGEYGFMSANGSYVRHYCPPVTTRCGLRGRWRSLANLDMTNSTEQCYSNLTQHTYSNRRFCVRNSNSAGCSSVQLHPTTAYRGICGLVRAYQFGAPDAFHSSSSIDSPYVEGVSITHGSPRQHIWTLAAALNEDTNPNGCPCINGGNDNRPPFVGNKYFCDTGTSTGRGSVFYGADPLWDGAGCGHTSTCCSFNNPPWFYRDLLQYTYDDVELRLCSDYNRNEEDIAIERIEIYVN